ncbi:disulfide bond formation protein B [Massilia solisilvae]|uniref:Disulfide bond formation protein B n=1 Tax=Massilia solisilvae TaxID=1811225 RepID=A0ABT2BN42_9BURK|nr:disulfide bond formation protein B [Massilia solisilvae]MCS0609938.1 disulfide bond formation protein B [Massilia solisilvae]
MTTSRNVLYAIAAACFALVGAALYLQHAQNMMPCPLCVIQRYLYLTIALCCLLGAAMGQPKVGAGLGLLGALGGLGVVGKHLYVLAHPGFSCGIDPMETMLNKIPTATAMPWMFHADGLCEDARDTLFGLSIPAWSAVWFAILAVSLAWLLVRGKR